MLRIPLLLLLVLAAGCSDAASGAGSSPTKVGDPPSIQGLPGSSPSVQKPAGKLLFLAPVGSKSQKNFYDALIATLASGGYEVTFITAYPTSRKRANVREVVVQDNKITDLLPNIFEDGKMAAMLTIFSLGPDLCFTGLMSSAATEVFKEDYDLVFLSVIFSECFLPRVRDMKVPFVVVSPVESFGPFSGYRMGNPAFPSMASNPLMKDTRPKSFLDRGVLALMDFAFWIFFRYNARSTDSKGRQLGLFPHDSPSIADISANASLMIFNSFRLMEVPRPYMPNMLLVGGIHCRPAQPLPQDLAKWVTSSGEAGFIFFSLGSVVKSSDIPDDKRQMLVSVFASLPQKVLWKYDGSSIPGLSDNVRLIKWAPQQDLLGDPHIRVFITHGGLLSTQEATYHGVPVLGMPLFGDQEVNMYNAEQQGWGRMLSWEELTYDKFKNTIELLMEDQNARQRVQTLNSLMRDQPTSPAEDLLWWTGYLLRTGGARHLRSGAADLYWYQLYNLDVWLTLGSIVMLLLWLVLKLLRALWRRCCGVKWVKQPSKQKKQ